ncbi:ParA family protein [Tautonia rosea]|uniref:ParA family protein n=1 Tax=Tautonia rosea TaxID=2728037 RepID=UPI0014750BC7|nr:ParA family protein [Tautonia rosea]
MESQEGKSPQEARRNTQIIAVGNQKGGVAKTTNAVHIAAALGELGKKCLIIDLDMNQGATRHLGVPSNSFLGSFEVLIGEEQPLDVVITDGDEDLELPKNVDIIPASRKLETTDQALLQRSKFIVEQDVLIKPLKSLEGVYDYIFLDTAPNANTPTIAAYKAARWFILAAMPDPLAITGLNDALVDIRDAQQNGNAELEILGVILSGVDGRKTRLATALISYVDKTFRFSDGSPAKFATDISRSVVVHEAQKVGKTLFETSPTHKLAGQYRKVAAEVEARVNGITLANLNDPEELDDGADFDDEEAAANA